ncbi:MAG: hypothetical protein J3K34DRAFT_520501, partial [Monoraphidium minutum]
MHGGLPHAAALALLAPMQRPHASAANSLSACTDATACGGGAARGGAPGAPPPPAAALPVVCGGAGGLLLPLRLRVLVGGGPGGVAELTPTEFERLGGKAAHKRWRTSIRLAAGCGPEW